ncbi:SlyX family protein [Paenirhodobacter populi]|uniref:SlyX family protein n=1 Tax=Paenirhodobacter populi TaxID=2306993 RepID=A0A443K9H6_9RHOB|nr:SlyX family protein [Sinirhodobacter populi]RWR06396.1 SlyX family protein [Sinirhodobacter populi]RWR11789.1 SlyX family protein [Sinirhodobacter populi]RWR18532.1 SlyX family protein [Sinirhodobacter populi]RWR28527.1 SlyX family protein [Sinirhodobacter populi]RWR29449.1 SlyX family protein [Sinirhodobacter populi]
MTDRIEHLEEQLAFLTKTVDELSDVVARQTLEIDRLGRSVGMLMEREAEREVGEGGQIPLADQKPPHW